MAFTTFHGGFGLVANGCIPKPTFWTFKFFKDLKENVNGCLYRDENTVNVEKEGGIISGIAWNKSLQRRMDDKTFYYDIEVNKESYTYLLSSVDESTCNPLKVWHDLGEPANLSKKQREIIRQSSAPFIQSSRITANNGRITFSIEAKENGVYYFECIPSSIQSDTGYSYSRVMGGENGII